MSSDLFGEFGRRNQDSGAVAVKPVFSRFNELTPKELKYRPFHMPDEPTPNEVSSKLLSGGLPIARLTSFPSASDRKLASVNRGGKETGHWPYDHSEFARSSGSHRGIHPSWLALVELCRELGYREIERLSI